MLLKFNNEDYSVAVIDLHNININFAFKESLPGLTFDSK